MAESPQNGDKIQMAAESALLQLASRWGVILMISTALPAGAWMGTRIIDQLDKQGVQLEEMSGVVLSYYLDNRDRISSLDVRVSGIERDNR